MCIRDSSLGYFGDEYDSFNPDIIRNINTAVLILYRVGALKIQTICNETSEWCDITPINSSYFEMIKDYICRKVKMLFDPPLQSNIYKAFDESVKELEWTLQEDQK